MQTQKKNQLIKKYTQYFKQEIELAKYHGYEMILIPTNKYSKPFEISSNDIDDAINLAIDYGFDMFILHNIEESSSQLIDLEYLDAA